MGTSGMSRLGESTEMQRIASAARNGACQRESRGRAPTRYGHGKLVVLFAALFGYLIYPLVHGSR